MGYRQLTQGCWIARTGEEPAQSRTKPGKSIAQSAAMSTLRLATIHSGSSRLAGGTPGFSRDASIRTVLRQGTRSPMAVRGASGETDPRGRGLVCMSSRAVFRRLRRLVVVTATSTVVLASGAGMSAAYAAADHSTGTAGTSGTVTSPQPLSTADQNTGGANGQCPGGPYCSTRDGSPSLNGNGGGNATGKPCAGCVGKADNKNPPGQMPDGSDHNNGYECDGNNGIGKTNPAHTGCKPALVGTCITAASGGVTWLLTNGNGFALTGSWTSGSQSGTVTIPAGGSATFTTTGKTVSVTFPGTTFAAVTGSKDCPAPQPDTQTIAAIIKICSTNVLAPSAGSQLAVEGTSLTGTNQLAESPVDAGGYTVDATAPTGYHFVACPANVRGGDQSIASTPTSATEGVNVPVGGAGVAYFYVEQDQTPQPPVQTLAGVIIVCSSGQQATGGTLSATGQGQTFTDEANPFGPVQVPAGDYTMTATPPSGYHLVVCAGKGSTTSETVTVPSGGAGLGKFYIEQDQTQPTHTPSAALFRSSSGQQATGGTLSATGQGQTFTDEANPFGPVQVPAGDYTMTATPPTGYHPVVCNGHGSTTSETVTVPSGGAGIGIFYVAPDQGSGSEDQTLAGVIYLCSNGHVVSGGTLSATGGATT